MHTPPRSKDKLARKARQTPDRARNAMPARLAGALVADGHSPDRIGSPEYLSGLSVRALLATPGIGPAGIAWIQAILAPHGRALEP